MLEWSEFAERLGRELAALDRDTILIVREHDESRHYVQAMREPDRLYAEAVSNNFLEGPLLLTPADEEVLTEAGWRPPTADWAPANWWTDLPPYATKADFAGLADMMVTALRDVQGLRRPADLVYESFHRHGTGLIELVDFGIRPADPARINESRATADLAADLGSPGRAPEEAGLRLRAGEGAALAAPARPEQPQPPPRDLNGATPPARRAPQPGVPRQVTAEDDTSLEGRLADAKRHGDHLACFELLLTADLLLLMTGPAADGQGPPEPATTVIGTGTYLMAFTSPKALAQALGERTDGHREVTFGDLAAAWPDPHWSLIINAGLPSEIRLDAATVARLDGMRRTAAQASAVDAVLDVAAAPAPVIRPPDGVRLWRYDGGETAPLAVYDAATSRWTSADTAPHAE